MIATAARMPRELLSLPLSLDNTSRDEKRPPVGVVCFRCGEAIGLGLGVQAQHRGQVHRTGWRPASYRGPVVDEMRAAAPSVLNVIVHPHCA